MVNWQTVLGTHYDEAMQAVESPHFDSMPDDWQRHVPDTVRNVWNDLNTDARLSAYITARAAVDDIVSRWDD